MAAQPTYVIEVVQPGYMEDPADGEGAIRVTLEGAGPVEVLTVFQALVRHSARVLGEREDIGTGETPDGASYFGVDALGEEAIQDGLRMEVGSWEHRLTVAAPVA